MATEIESAASIRAQERARAETHKIARKHAEAASKRAPIGERADTYQRVFDLVVDVHWDRAYQDFYREEYSSELAKTVGR